MHPIHHLRKLLQEPRTNQGKVVQISGSSLIIATPRGSLSVQKNDNDLTTYNTGDTVLLANGVVIGRRNKQPTVYVI